MVSSRLVEIFDDVRLVEKIKSRLPYLFQLAESESSRAGKLGMQVGSARAEESVENGWYESIYKNQKKTL